MLDGLTIIQSTVAAGTLIVLFVSPASLLGSCPLRRRPADEECCLIIVPAESSIQQNQPVFSQATSPKFQRVVCTTTGCPDNWLKPAVLAPARASARIHSEGYSCQRPIPFKSHDMYRVLKPYPFPHIIMRITIFTDSRL